MRHLAQNLFSQLHSLEIFNIKWTGTSEDNILTEIRNFIEDTDQESVLMRLKLQNINLHKQMGNLMQIIKYTTKSIMHLDLSWSALTQKDMSKIMDYYTQRLKKKKNKEPPRPINLRSFNISYNPCLSLKKDDSETDSMDDLIPFIEIESVHSEPEELLPG